MDIQVLGTGCIKCKKLFELTKKAVSELGLSENVVYSTDISKILEMGVMESPIISVDGKPVMLGFTSDIKRIKEAITSSKVNKNKSCKCSCGGNC